MSHGSAMTTKPAASREVLPSLSFPDIQPELSPMIVVRVITGIRSHWHVRATEWLMIYPAVAMGAALIYQPDMFQTSKSFADVAEWMTQAQWSLLALSCALVRIIALTVNGTFETFRYSPHMRALASFTGIFFWSQFCLGLLSTALYGGGSWSGPIMYSTACLMELLNIYRSWMDIARGGNR